ncbi:hypothetical protein D9M72_290260 [compost metagenome]
MQPLQRVAQCRERLARIAQVAGAIGTRGVAVIAVQPRLAAVELRAQLRHGLAAQRLRTRIVNHAGQPRRRAHAGIRQRLAQAVGQRLALPGKTRRGGMGGLPVHAPRQGQRARQEQRDAGGAQRCGPAALPAGPRSRHRRLRQAALQRRLFQRLRGFGKRRQRGFPAGLVAGRGLLQPRGGLLQVARIDRVEPAVVAQPEVGIGHRVRGVETEGRQRTRDVAAHGSGAIGLDRVAGNRFGQPGAHQQEHGIVQQRLRHAHMPLLVLAQQQVGTSGKALGQQVGRQQPMRERAEHQPQHMPDAAVRVVGGAARLLLAGAHFVQRRMQRQPGLAQQDQVLARGGQAHGLQQRGLELLARARDGGGTARRQQHAGQHLQLVEPQVGRMHALLAQLRQHAGVGLEQPQRGLVVAGHQVVDIFRQCLHAGAEHRQRLRVGGELAGIDGLQQPAQRLAVRIGAAQPDNVHRAGGLVQVLAGKPQRGGIARAQRLGRLADFIDVVAQLRGRVFERAAQARREPRQPGQVARRAAGIVRLGRHGSGGRSRQRRRFRFGHGERRQRCVGIGRVARDGEIQGHDGFQCGAARAAAGGPPRRQAGAGLACWQA